MVRGGLCSDALSTEPLNSCKTFNIHKRWDTEFVQIHYTYENRCSIK